MRILLKMNKMFQKYYSDILAFRRAAGWWQKGKML